MPSNVLSFFQGEDANGAREGEPFSAPASGIKKEGAVKDSGKGDMTVAKHHGVDLFLFYRAQNLGEDSVFFQRAVAKKNLFAGQCHHFFLR